MRSAGTMSAAARAEKPRTAGDLSGIFFMLTFFAGALCGLFLASGSVPIPAWAFDPASLAESGSLERMLLPAAILSGVLFAACFRPLRPALLGAGFFEAMSAVFCAGICWWAWGIPGLWLACRLLLPRLLLFAVLALWQFSCRAPLFRRFCFSTAMPLLFAAQYLLFPYFIAPLIPMMK